jgi:hypothetical protein
MATEDPRRRFAMVSLRPGSLAFAGCAGWGGTALAAPFLFCALALCFETVVQLCPGTICESCISAQLIGIHLAAPPGTPPPPTLILPASFPFVPLRDVAFRGVTDLHMERFSGRECVVRSGMTWDSESVWFDAHPAAVCGLSV